jgi:hypothetical protein
MNLIVHCQGCGALYRCFGDTGLVGEGSSWWPTDYVCPMCQGNAVGMHEEDLPRAMQTALIKDLLPEELFAALHGMGMPEDRHATADSVKDMLLTKKITSVLLTDVKNTERCVIDKVVFEDGTKLYLGASTLGAVVYRVTAPVKYSERV